MSVLALAAAAAGVGLAVTRGGDDKRHGPSGAAGRAAALRGIWTLTAFPDGSAVPPTSTNTQLSLDATGMLVAGDGCNTMSGHIDVTADTISVGDLATTAMGCANVPPARQAFTDAIHQLMIGTVRWSVDGDRLTLTKGSTTLTYRRLQTGGVHDPDLVRDTAWRLDTIADAGSDGSASSSSDYAPITLRFTQDATFVVTYLCVTESGGAVTGNATMTLDVRDRLDAKPCPSASSDLDQRVRARLTGPLTWSIAAGQLRIERAGVGSLTFASVMALTPTARASS